MLYLNTHEEKHSSQEAEDVSCLSSRGHKGRTQELETGEDAKEEFRNLVRGCENDDKAKAPVVLILAEDGKGCKMS